MNKYCLSRQQVAGFTLFELLTTITIVGILSAIAIPSFIGLINRQRLNNAQDQVFTVMRNAQASAKRERRTWAACFRDDGTKVLSAVNPLPESGVAWACNNATNWQPLLGEDSKQIAIKISETSFTASPATYYPVKFKYDGSATPLGHITLVVRNETNGLQRCVYVATLLGALRTAKQNSTANPDGYYCY